MKVCFVVGLVKVCFVVGFVFGFVVGLGLGLDKSFCLGLLLLLGLG